MNPPAELVLGSSAQSALAGASAPDDSSRRKNMQLLIQLRWLAVLGQIAAISVTHWGFGIRLPFNDMLAALIGLVIFNAVSLLRLRMPRRIGNLELLVALLVDVAMLTAQLSLSGGAGNPFVFLYLLQVSLGAVLLPAKLSWIMVALAIVCFIGLALFGRPLALPFDHDLGLFSPYVQGLLICFALNAVLLAVFITRINRNLRARDAHLANLRQRAAEQEHIVRMGLLASGAAHELGTPLATLAVILGDWRRMPAFVDNPELLQELDEMQAQILRCKSIVSGILLSAGEARGESPVLGTVRTFFEELATQWRGTRPVAGFAFQNRFGPDLSIICDSAIKQMICNVLDNALEASPQWVGFELGRIDDTLTLTITDAGPGFDPAMLARLGQPYQSSKNRPGSGLGLFLVVNVARTLGGSVTVSNRPQGGAAVTIALPLASMAPGRQMDKVHEH